MDTRFPTEYFVEPRPFFFETHGCSEFLVPFQLASAALVFSTSLVPPLLVRGVREALAGMPGPIILIANLLTEGRGMAGFSAGDAARWVSRVIGRPVDVVIANTGRPSEEAVMRYASEHKQPLELGTLDPETESVLGRFWRSEIARHDRRRLAFAVWTVLSQRLLHEGKEVQKVQVVQ